MIILYILSEEDIKNLQKKVEEDRAFALNESLKRQYIEVRRVLERVLCLKLRE
jgi:hypothetical protein